MSVLSSNVTKRIAKNFRTNECSRKSHVCKMYEIVSKQVKFTQHIGTCKSAYTKGYALN